MLVMSHHRSGSMKSILNSLVDTKQPNSQEVRFLKNCPLGCPCSLTQTAHEPRHLRKLNRCHDLSPFRVDYISCQVLNLSSGLKGLYCVVHPPENCSTFIRLARAKLVLQLSQGSCSEADKNSLGKARLIITPH